MYIRSILKFLECGDLLEEQSKKREALRMYKDTASFLQRIQTICRDAGELESAKLWYASQAKEKRKKKKKEKEESNAICATVRIASTLLDNDKRICRTCQRKKVPLALKRYAS
jgi:hypothetical protein